MCKSQIIESLLKKIFQTVERILANSETITSPSFYLLTPSGMERLESTCMLLIAIGEGVKGVDKLTDKKLLSFYPEMDWKGVMGMRDIIAHHYFDLDAEIVYDVIKHDLPKLKDVLQQIIDDLKYPIKRLTKWFLSQISKIRPYLPHNLDSHHYAIKYSHTGIERTHECIRLVGCRSKWGKYFACSSCHGFFLSMDFI